jgi:hypothetical protein
MALTLHSGGHPYDTMPTAAYRLHPESVARQTEGTSHWLIEEKSLQLDSLREHRALWSEILDPAQAVRRITRPLLRPSLRCVFRGEFAAAASLWRLSRTAA